MAKSLADLRQSASELLNRYTDPTKHYAYRTYDHLYGYDGPLTPGDVLMANLLSLRLTWSDVIPLFAAAEGPEQRLRQTLDEVLDCLSNSGAYEDHSDLTALEATLEPLARANSATEEVSGWTAVTVSKVLHRRRPHIVPLIDSRVRAFYRVRHPREVRRAMWEDIQANKDWLHEVAQRYQTPDGRPLSILRVADILIWTPAA